MNPLIDLLAFRRLSEGLHHGEDNVLVIVLLDAGEVQIGGEPSLVSQKYFPKTGAALESQPVQDAALGQKLKQECQHHFLLSDHDVAKAGFSGVTLHPKPM